MLSNKSGGEREPGAHVLFVHAPTFIAKTLALFAQQAEQSYSISVE